MGPREPLSSGEGPGHIFKCWGPESSPIRGGASSPLWRSSRSVIPGLARDGVRSQVRTGAILLGLCGAGLAE